MLPLSKAVPKELLPVGDLPAIHHVVMEAMAAGIEHIILITHANKTALVDYFDNHAELNAKLAQKGNLPREIIANPNIICVRQNAPLGLGHAIMRARAVLGDVPFCVLLPDVVLGDIAVSGVAREHYLTKMIDDFMLSHQAQVLLEPVARENVDKYGIVALDGSHITQIIEKPSLNHAPSNLAVVGRYVLPSNVLDILEDLWHGRGATDTHELGLTCALAQLVPNIGATVMTHKSYDVGNMTSYLATNRVFIDAILGK